MLQEFLDQINQNSIYIWARAQLLPILTTGVILTVLGFLLRTLIEHKLKGRQARELEEHKVGLKEKEALQARHLELLQQIAELLSVAKDDLERNEGHVYQSLESYLERFTKSKLFLDEDLIAQASTANDELRVVASHFKAYDTTRGVRLLFPIPEAQKMDKLSQRKLQDDKEGIKARGVNACSTIEKAIRKKISGTKPL